jgi:ABC-2 type transport system ATP-binding protein
MIRVSHLRKTFGSFLAVDDLAFSLGRGEVLGFLGPNGAGKSTTMKMITGFLRPDAGSIAIGDIDVHQNPRAAQRLIGYLPEGAPAWAEMTPRSFLDFIADIRLLTSGERTRALGRAIEITELQAVLDQPIETLSKGYRRRVGLAQAILHDPPVLIMDEPTDGLDPNQKHHVRRAIAEMADEKAIIISTHILEEVDAVCSRVLIIDRGREVASGRPSDLAAQSRYSGAVSVTLDVATAAALLAALPSWSEVDAHEEIIRGSEISLTLIPRHGQSEALLQKLRDQTAFSFKTMALEQGRLDDVFRRLTGRAE